MRVYINGQSREVQGTPSLAELISQLDLPAARIAVELNREVVRRSEWGNMMLHDEDRIEIVQLVGGGDQEAGAESRSREQEQTGELAHLLLPTAPAPGSRSSSIECRV